MITYGDSLLDWCVLIDRLYYGPMQREDLNLRMSWSGSNLDGEALDGIYSIYLSSDHTTGQRFFREIEQEKF